MAVKPLEKERLEKREILSINWGIMKTTFLTKEVMRRPKSSVYHNGTTMITFLGLLRSLDQPCTVAKL
jgi:hypothetical protein